MKSETKREYNNRVVGGVALIMIGFIALAAQLLPSANLGMLVMPALAVIFIAWGALTRESGFFIPGGILAGIGAGALLISGPFQDAGEQLEGGVFMLAFAAGWLLIPALSILFTSERHAWALIPAGIMALIGAALLVGGAALTVLEAAGVLWPVLLILGGLFLIFRQLLRPAA